MSTTVRRIAWNAATNWIATFINGILGLIIVPFLIAKVGKAGFGLVGVIFVIMSTAELADLGMRGAIGRQLAEQLARGDKRAYNAIASSAVFAALAIGLVAASIVYLAAPGLVGWFKIEPELEGQALFLIRWFGGAWLLISSVIPVFSGVITSNNRFDVNNFIQVIANLWRCASVLLIVGLTKSGLYGWAIAMYSTELLRLVLGMLQARRIVPTLRIHPSLITRDAMRGIFGLGGYLFGFRLTDLLAKQSDPIVLAKILGTAAVALYTPAIQLLNQVHPIIMTLAEQLHPLATGYHVKDQGSGLKQLLITGTKLTMLLGVPVVVVCVVFAEPIMRIWLSARLGPDYIVCAHVLMIWAVVQLTQYAVGSQWAVLLGMKRLTFLFWITLPLAVVNVIVSVLLVRYTSLGVIGVVIPTAVLGLLRRPVVAAYAARVVGMPVRQYFAGGYGRPMIVMAILAGAAWTIERFAPAVSVVSLAGDVILVGLLWGGLCWTIGFDATDRARFLGLARAVLQRIGRRPKAGHCAQCGYDLQGLADPRCPECGAVFTVSTKPT